LLLQVEAVGDLQSAGIFGVIEVVCLALASVGFRWRFCENEKNNK